MSVVSQSIPNLINGISQQNPVQRNIGQAESQINFQSNIIDGLSKRPPTEFVKNLLASTVFPNNCAIHWINRDSCSNRAPSKPSIAGAYRGLNGYKTVSIKVKIRIKL